MSEEQINIAIAEACGWRWVTRRQQEGLRDDVRGYPPNVECVGLNERYVPDYCNDLNALHEAEKTLNDEQDLDYSESLEIVVHGKFNCNSGEDMRRLRSATARQRAEAFLRTIGKWEGGPQ